MATTRIRRLWQREPMVRSQNGPLVSVPFTALPIHRISRMDPAVQNVALETPPHASPPFAPPVWPSPRRPWPPPRSVQQSWGVGQHGVRCRKCCRSNLQGRRRASVHKRHASGLGHFPSTQLRRMTFGSGIEDGVALKEARRQRSHVP